MTSRDFCYWLQGVFEVGKPETLNAEQVGLIKRHLNMVFVHEIDPSMGGAEHQAELQAAHDGKPPEPAGPPRPPLGGAGPCGTVFRC